MKTFELSWLLSATGGAAVSTVAERFDGLGTDTRGDLQGKLFIALAGESFDAHDFAADAVARGAGGLVIHRWTPALEAMKGRVTIVQVTDTLTALQAMGRAARRASKAFVIGLTGSNGKTTTKEFTAAVLSPFRDVHWSKGSFNNHWGVPFTLLELEPEHEVAVVEMGMNHPGEITTLVGIAEPDAVLCTMVGRAHVEHFGSVENIAAAKEEIYEAARPDAVRIYNLDNPWTRAMHDKASARFPKARRLTFSSESAADVRLRIADLTMRDLVVEGRIAGVEAQARVPVFGAQNLVNLMAAAASGLAAGLGAGEIWESLGHCRTAWGRNQFVKLKSGAEMIFDAYNANPDSMAALLENMALVKVSGRRVGVFGQMRELGSQSPVLHEELGRLVGARGFDEIFFVGSDREAFQRGLKSGGHRGSVRVDEDFTESMGSELAGGLRDGDIVIVKGSRGMKLERFVIPCEPLDFGGK